MHRRCFKEETVWNRFLWISFKVFETINMDHELLVLTSLPFRLQCVLFVTPASHLNTLCFMQGFSKWTFIHKVGWSCINTPHVLTFFLIHSAQYPFQTWVSTSIPIPSFLFHLVILFYNTSFSLRAPSVMLDLNCNSFSLVLFRWSKINIFWKVSNTASCSERDRSSGSSVVK